MKFEREHTLHGSIVAVETALLERDFWESLRIPDVAPVHVDSIQRDTVTLQLAYTGSLDAIARTVLGTDRVRWTQTVALDRRAHRGTLTITPHSRVKATVAAQFTLAAIDADVTLRTLRGDLAVKVPLAGNALAGQLLPGVLSRLDLEAAALSDWVATA